MAEDTTEAKPPFRWISIYSPVELKLWYHSLLPKLTQVAKAHGYALAVHGSMERDFDLIAVPWAETYSQKGALAKALHEAACGTHMAEYEWEKKPNGRKATSFAICWPEWQTHGALSVGHIDLSVVPG